jgi:hypothetical protein
MASLFILGAFVGFNPDGLVSIFVLIAAFATFGAMNKLAHWAGVEVGSWLTSLKRARKDGAALITLNLRTTRPVDRASLCKSCVYAHVIAGYTRGVEIVFCGYAFPLREIPFPVRTCTDFRIVADPDAKELVGFGEPSTREVWEEVAEFQTITVSRE